MRSLVALDLFAGAGGVTAGFKRAGVRVAVAVELDPVASETYRSNHPEVTLLQRDIRRVPARQVQSLLGRRRLDILTACSPCGSYSSLRRGRGSAASKDLALQVVRFARALRPRALIVENVPPLQHDHRFRKLIQSLEALGYELWWGVLDSQFFGVPQRRKRLVLIGQRKGVPEAPATARRIRVVDEAIRGLSAQDPLHRLPKPAPQVLARIRAVSRDGGSRDELPPELVLRCHDELRSKAATNVYGRMKGNEPAPTLTTRCTTPACGRFIHPRANRPITLREAACLQTFPRRYRFVGTREQIERQIGNAVPVELAYRIVRHVLRSFKAA